MKTETRSMKPTDIIYVVDFNDKIIIEMTAEEFAACIAQASRGWYLFYYWQEPLRSRSLEMPGSFL